MSVSALQLITDALTATNIIAAGETPEAADVQRALRLLNVHIMDPWNAIKPFATHRTITSGTFAASTATRTIGPTGSYVLSLRPDEILQAHWVDTDGIRQPITLRDPDWYAALNDPARTETVITDIAYFPTVPNGTLYPWPIPESAVTVELETRSILTRFAGLSTTASFAPGYEAAIIDTLEELCCAVWGAPMPDNLPERARMARNVVMSPRTKSPRMATIPY